MATHCITCSTETSRALVKQMCGKCYNAKHRLEHPEIYLKSRQKNKASIRERDRKYALANQLKRNANEAKRRAAKRFGALSDTKTLQDFYKNCPTGMVVDHIIPLQGKDVSGLHVVNNLQYLTPEENTQKSNKFDGTFDNNGWRR